MTLRPLVAGAVLTASLALPSVAAAATSGYVTVDLNLRAGPSTAYPVVATMYAGAPVTVYGCLSDWGWCDVAWEGWRGWASGSYLQVMYQAQPVYLPTYAPRIGLPIISFEFTSYWDDHYRGRPWFRERDRWYNYWRERREDRREVREDRRERQEDIAERREDRGEVREDRQERREDRADRRDDQRQDARQEQRQDTRQERRQEQRQDTRQERRQEQRQDARQDRRQEQRQDARQERRRGGGEGEENCVTRPNGRVVCE